MEQDSPAWQLKRAFDPFFPAPVEDWQSFADLCTEKSWERDHVLKAAGEAERYFYFILEGSIGVFLWRENHPVCLNFAFEGHFFGDYTSLLTGQPGPLEVMTLEKTRCLRITREHYLALGQTPEGSLLMRVAAESSLIAKQQQQIDLLTKTAEQRYEEMMQQRPDWVRRLPQKHLASYLGITPQSLSRIRRG